MKNDGIFGELRNFGKVRFLMSSLHIYYSWAQGFIEGSDNVLNFKTCRFLPSNAMGCDFPSSHFLCMYVCNYILIYTRFQACLCASGSMNTGYLRAFLKRSPIREAGSHLVLCCLVWVDVTGICFILS